MSRRRGTAARLAAAALAVALLVARPAEAQTSCSGTCTVQTNLNFNVAAVMQLSLSSGSTTLTAPTAASYTTGFTATTGPLATLKSNGSWVVLVHAGSAVWSATNTVPGVAARTDKPASDLEIATAAGGPFTALSTTPVNLTQGSATASASATLHFRTRFQWTLDTPGAYSLPIVFTVLTP